MGLRTLAVAWNVMWSLSYIVVSLIAPDISLDTPAFLYTMLGVVLFVVLILSYIATTLTSRIVVSAMLSILGVLMVYGGIASWAGVGLWNIPFANIELFQVSMAFANLLSAVFIFYIVIDLIKEVK